MGKHKLVKESENPSFTTSPLRNLKKSTSRRIWIFSFLIVFTIILIWFPPSITLLTWRSEYDSSIDRSSLVINVKDISRPAWGNELESITTYLDGPPPAKVKSNFRKVTDNEEGVSPNSSPPPDKSFDLIDEASQGADKNEEIKETPNIFEMIVIKEAPSKPYKPLPKIRLDPSLKYENVKGVNHLTKELEQTKFLTFLPHSGFHNQRIEIKNAFKVAKLLNRTLILPALRLGRPLAWQPSEELVKVLENDELKYERFEDCLDVPSKIKPHDTIQEEECNYYSSWTSVRVGYIFNIEELTKEVPIIDRVDLHETWLWHTLKLSPGEWLEVKDDSRYSYQIFESSIAESLPSSSKYNWRLNIDDLATYNEARLLSFGSLFGSNRVILNSKEMENWNKKIEENQALDLPLLEKISDKAAERLGGRGKYLGLHLRVGNAFFKTQAPQVIQATFIDICKNILKLNQETIDDLVRKHDGMMDKKADLQDHTDHTSLFKSRKVQDGSNHWDDIARSKKDHYNMQSEMTSPKPKKKLKCRMKLHNHDQKQDEELIKKLNLPIYLSTDVTFNSIENKPSFSIFSSNFPCLFSFEDFNFFDPTIEKKYPIKRFNYEKTLVSNQKNSHNLEGTIDKRRTHSDVKEEVNFHQMKSNLDGLNLDRFLIPILESMIVSKGSHIIGTPGSTFSNYLINFLHPFYLVEQKNNLLT